MKAVRDFFSNKYLRPVLLAAVAAAVSYVTDHNTEFYGTAALLVFALHEFSHEYLGAGA